jgi:hypothetical protein
MIQQLEQGRGGLGMANQAEGFHGRNAHVAVCVIQGILERRHGAGISGLPQRGGGGIASGTSRIFECGGQNFHGFGAVDGSVLVLTRGDGTENKFDIVARTPSHCAQGTGGLPANGVAAATRTSGTSSARASATGSRAVKSPEPATSSIMRQRVLASLDLSRCNFHQSI